MTERDEKSRNADDHRLPGEGTPLIVGVVVETVPDKAEGVALRLEKMEGVRVVGGDGKNRIAIVWDGPDGKRLESSIRELIQKDEEILGVYPTFAGLDQ